MIQNARRFAVCKGTGISTVSYMNAFDEALADAGIGNINLIKVSSVLPPKIVETKVIPEDFGAFRPCVMARAQGFNQHLTAGLCYGFREDESGGYVAEYAVVDSNLSGHRFEDKLYERLISMGESRGVKMVNVRKEIIELKVEKDVYGCAVVVLVYLP